MPDVPISGVPPIPPLSTIGDDKLDVKKVLAPLIAGWETRNGTTGDPDQAFVRVIDLREGRRLATDGATMVAAGTPRYETRTVAGRQVRVQVGTEGQAKPVAPAASAVADLLKGGTSEGLSDRVAELESPEWFKRQLASYGADSAQRGEAERSGQAQGTTDQGKAYASAFTPDGPSGTVWLTQQSLTMDLAAGDQVLLVGECGYVRQWALDAPGGLFRSMPVVTSVNFATQTVVTENVKIFSEDVVGGGTCDLGLFVVTPASGVPALIRFRAIVAGHAMVVANSTLALYTATHSGAHTFYLKAGERSSGYYTVGAGWPASLVAVVL